jgi:hypothetical protein
MTRLFIHLGMHKTGTTSIQRYLDDARFYLHRVGVLYPASGRHPLAANQHGLVAKAFDPANPFIGEFALTGPIQRDVIVTALRHEIELSGMPTVVLSSEEMSRYGPQSVADLKAAFAGYELYPVVFIRKFTSILDGYYATLLQWTSEYYELNEQYIITDLVHALRPWAAIAADGRIRVVDVDASPTGDSVTDFLSVVGIDKTIVQWCPPGPRRNASPSPIAVAATRELRFAGVNEGEIRSLLQGLRGLPTMQRYTCIPPTLWADLETRYASEHASLRAAPWVVGLEDSGPPQLSEIPTHLDSMAAVALAMGRGLASLVPAAAG